MSIPSGENGLTQLSVQRPPVAADPALDTASHPHAALVDEGLRQAALIPNPVARGRHRAAWLMRLAAIQPATAADLAGELSAESGDRLRLLLQVVQDRVRLGDMELEPHFSQVLALARAATPDLQLRALNTLSEAAVDLAVRSPEQARHLLHALEPEARALLHPEDGDPQAGVLACALVGEALLAGGDVDRGLPLLHEAEAGSAEIPGREPVVAFLASALAEHEPERAIALADTLEDPSARLDARLQLAGKLEAPEVRARLLDGVEADARWLEHYRGPETLAQVGEALVKLSPERARRMFEEGLESADRSGSQFRGLQWTGIAAAASTLDREWAGTLFQEALRSADAEEDPIRRITTWILIANEMADAFPRDAAEVFQRAMDDAIHMESNWELGHVADVVFRPDRSPYLDVHPARPVLDRLLDRLSDEDPRIPGVIGLAEVGQWMAQVDAPAAVAVIQRGYRNAEAAGDTDGMTAAAVAIHKLDTEAGEASLRVVHAFLLHRIDCPAMGMFARQVAPIDPELVLQLADQIPDFRERWDAQAAAAVHLYETQPERALAVIRALELPADRSIALLHIVDRLLQTTDRPQPQPLLEDLP